MAEPTNPPAPEAPPSRLSYFDLPDAVRQSLWTPAAVAALVARFTAQAAPRPRWDHRRDIQPRWRRR